MIARPGGAGGCGGGLATIIGADPSGHNGGRGGYAGEPYAVMLPVGAFSPLGPLGTLNHRFFLATH